MIEDALASQVHPKVDATTMPRQGEGQRLPRPISPRNLQCRTVLFMRNAREQGIGFRAAYRSAGGMHRARHVSWVAIPEGGQMKKIGDVMTGHVCVASPNDSIRKAAELMAQSDIGSLPVGENDRLIGMITDRDIVVRAVAMGRGDATLVREVMTEQIRYCFEDEDVLDVAKNMSDLGVRRLPVLDRQKRLVGIVALSNIASGGTDQARDALLEGVATPH